MISPTLARWHWAYLGSAMLKPAKSLIPNKYLTVKKGFSYLTKFKQKSVLLLLFFSFGVGEEGGGIQLVYLETPKRKLSTGGRNKNA